MSFLGEIYNQTPLKRLFEIAGLDYQARAYYRRYREWISGTRTIEVNNISGNFSNFTLIADQYLEPELDVLSDFLGEVQSDDVIYDIGADAGLYTVLVGEMVSNGKVIAFEPHPLRRESLKRNLNLNTVSAIVRTEALGNKQTKAELSYGLHTNDRNELEVAESGDFSVTVNRADQLIPEEIPPPDVIKVDVEGAEYSVLKGFGDLLNDSQCRIIYIEIHEKIVDFGDDKDKLLTLLHQNGYETKEILTRSVEHSEESFIKAIRKSE
jgi:FkbM family methyltransferase